MRGWYLFPNFEVAVLCNANAPFTVNTGANAFAQTPNASTLRITITDFCSLISGLTIRWVIGCSIGFSLHELNHTHEVGVQKRGSEIDLSDPQKTYLFSSQNFVHQMFVCWTLHPLTPQPPPSLPQSSYEKTDHLTLPHPCRASGKCGRGFCSA